MHDAIIIGAGIGGLICGCSLAKNKKNVLIVEQHKIPGGCCTSFVRGEFTFDAGAHLFSGCNENGIVHRILKYLDVNETFFKARETESLFYKDTHYECPTDLKKLKDYLKQVNPNESEKIDAFFRNIRNYNQKKIIESMTYQEMLDKYFDSDDIKIILSYLWLYAGLEPSKLNALDGIEVFQSYWNGGSFYSKGGAQKIINNIEKRFLEYNGTIEYKKRIVKIIKQGDYFHLIDNHGNDYYSEYLINNGDFKSFYSMFEDKSLMSEQAAAYYKNGKESIALFCSYIGVKCEDEYVIGKDGWYFENDINEPVLISIPTLYDKSLCPPNYHIIEIMSKCSKDDKELQIQNHFKRCDKIFPNLKPKIIKYESANYNTFRRYTLNASGCAYGWEHSMEQSSSKRMSAFLGDKIYQVGHWACYGSGIMSAVISGQIVSQKIRNKEGLF